MDNKRLLELTTIAKKIRSDIIEMNYYAGSGHPGGSLSCVEIITYLYWEVMNISPEIRTKADRDRFILSKGHSCLALYAALYQKGFFKRDEFKGLRKAGNMLQGHPDRLTTPGVEFNSGSLGQGISFAVGCALGARLCSLSFMTYALLGDGELNEGQVWEALMFAAHKGLDNLIAVIDYNKLQSDDFCENVTSLEPLLDKIKAFNWHVLEVDGHNFYALEHAFDRARKIKRRPTMIIAHTVKGKGVDFMENSPKWHGSIGLSKEEWNIAQKSLF